MATPIAISRQRALVQLDYAFLLGMVLVVAAILTAAIALQYANRELPCPLCLLERVALFGIAASRVRGAAR